VFKTAITPTFSTRLELEDGHKFQLNMSDKRTHIPSKGYYGYRYIKSPTDMPFIYRYFSEAFTPSQQSMNLSTEGSELRDAHKGVQPMVGYGGYCRGGQHAKVGRSIAHKARIECVENSVHDDATYRIRKNAYTQCQRSSDSFSGRLRNDNDGYLKRVLQRKHSFR